MLDELTAWCSCFAFVGDRSHPLRPTHGDEHGAVLEVCRLALHLFRLTSHFFVPVVQYERFEPTPEPIPEDYVLKPIYSRGREIWISDDSTHLHSTPDRQNREGLWRFM